MSAADSAISSVLTVTAGAAAEQGERKLTVVMQTMMRVLLTSQII